MEIVRDSIYNFPKYYDLVYGSDWRAEIDFLESCFERFCPFVVQRLFEPACGTGRLIRQFAKIGYQVSGVDLSEKSVEFCNDRLAKIESESQVHVGDMTDFQTPQRFHASFNTINSFRHLLSHQHAVDHLRCMARGLVDGGIYVLGVHLSPTQGDACTDEHWSASRGHLRVNTSMWLTDRDLEHRFEEFHLRFDVYTPTRQMRIEDHVKFRTYTLPEFRDLLSYVPEFEIAQTFDFSYQINSPVQIDERTEDVVFVFRKK
ncbi:class I SAM-dependent methyltransferase [Vicingaceae bacterium]|nr:class I SAM-dependent methyltransferase [Vicingaceae bacterium]